MARTTVAEASKREQPMTHEQRRALIESPISINIIGSSGKSHAGCDIRRARRPQPSSDSYMDHVTPEDYAAFFKHYRYSASKKGRTQ